MVLCTVLQLPTDLRLPENKGLKTHLVHITANRLKMPGFALPLKPGPPRPHCGCVSVLGSIGSHSPSLQVIIFAAIPSG